MIRVKDENFWSEFKFIICNLSLILERCWVPACRVGRVERGSLACPGPRPVQARENCSRLFKWSKDLGEVAEWLKVAVSKTVRGRKVPREFKSLPLRQFFVKPKIFNPEWEKIFGLWLEKKLADTGEAPYEPVSEMDFFQNVPVSECLWFLKAKHRRCNQNDKWVR